VKDKFPQVDSFPTDRESLTIRTELVLAKGGLNYQGSPGYPFQMYFKTNGEVIQNMYCELVAAVVELLLIYAQPVDYTLTQEERFEKFQSELCRVFIKDEPHNETKFAQKRFRIIISVPLHFQIASKVLNQEANEADIEYVNNNPAKPGWNTTDSGLADVCKFVKENIPNPLGSDIQAFDFSCNEFSFWIMVGCRIARFRNPSPALVNMIINLNLGQDACYYVTSDGRVFKFTAWGIRLTQSGKYTTASDNSVVRSTLPTAISVVSGKSIYVPAMAMGDDCVESNQFDSDELMKEAYRKIGFVVTDVEHIKRNERGELRANWCSHFFDLDTGLACPSNYSKSLANLFDLRANYHEALMSHLEELRHSKRMGVLDPMVVIRILQRVGWPSDVLQEACVILQNKF